MRPSSDVAWHQRVRRPEFLRYKPRSSGAGPTLACGTAACAAMVAARRRECVDTTATIVLPGGELTISWDGNEREYEYPVMMTGGVSHICVGEISEDVA